MTWKRFRTNYCLTIRLENVYKSSRTTRLDSVDGAWFKFTEAPYREANKTLSEAKEALDEIEKLLSAHVELPQFGQVLVAFQEYAEAKLLFQMKKTGKLASLSEIGTSSTAYLLGMLDFIGEMRRMILDCLRNGKTDDAQHLLTKMEKVYEDLFSLDRTSILPNFRRKLDAARRILETTRGDVASDMRRVSLEKALRSLERRLGPESSRINRG